MYLLIGSGKQGKQKIGEGHGVDEPLDPLDGGALGHDVQFCWGTVTSPTLCHTKQDTRTSY